MRGGRIPVLTARGVSVQFDPERVKSLRSTGTHKQRGS